MKIVIVSDGFPASGGAGAEMIAYSNFINLKKVGHEVYAVISVHKKEEAGVDGNGIYKIYIPKYHLRWRSYKCLFNRHAIKQFKKILKNLTPDIVHFHSIHYYLSYATFKVAKKYAKKVFLTAHDVNLFHQGKLDEFINKQDLSIPEKFDYKVSIWQQIRRYKRWYNPFRNIVIKYYLRYVDKIFAVSTALKNALEQNGIKKEVEVIHNGLDVKKWGLLQNEVVLFKNKHHLNNKKIVFFGGRFSGLKGGAGIVDIMEQVNKYIPNTILLVMGKRDNEAEGILKIAQNKGLQIIITGWLSGNDRIAAYRACDVSLVPSYYLDPFPTMALEAMACSQPVVGTCFGGVREAIIDNKTGFIVNPYNIEMTAKAIIDLLNNPGKAIKFGKAGHQRIKDKFNVNNQIKNIIKYYE